MMGDESRPASGAGAVPRLLLDRSGQSSYVGKGLDRALAKDAPSSRSMAGLEQKGVFHAQVEETQVEVDGPVAKACFNLRSPVRPRRRSVTRSTRLVPSLGGPAFRRRARTSANASCHQTVFTCG